MVGCPPPFWLTISCSPLDNPRLEIGSSGINVKLLGGYPAFTKRRIEVSYDEPNVTDAPSCREGSISVILYISCRRSWTVADSRSTWIVETPLGCLSRSCAIAVLAGIGGRRWVFLQAPIGQVAASEMLTSRRKIYSDRETQSDRGTAGSIVVLVLPRASCAQTISPPSILLASASCFVSFSFDTFNN